jgi:hypothetical protein
MYKTGHGHLRIAIVGYTEVDGLAPIQMPTKPRPEDRLIDIFLSAYEENSWSCCEIDRLDQKQDGAVEVLATRTSDGLTLAIEHTLIQPYGEYSRDFAWHSVFLPIEKDQSLITQNRAIKVFVSAGTLKPGGDWKLTAKTVHEWLRGHVLALPNGESSHIVPVAGSSGVNCRLLIKVEEIPNFEGPLRVGIDGSLLPLGSLAVVVEKALATKVPKLAKTKADRRILLLERREWTLSEGQITDEIDRRRNSFPELNQIQEIWFAETVFYESSDYVRFSVRKDGEPVRVLAFRNGRLRERHG